MGRRRPRLRSRRNLAGATTARLATKSVALRRQTAVRLQQEAQRRLLHPPPPPPPPPPPRHVAPHVDLLRKTIFNEKMNSFKKKKKKKKEFELKPKPLLPSLETFSS